MVIKKDRNTRSTAKWRVIIQPLFVSVNQYRGFSKYCFVFLNHSNKIFADLEIYKLIK